MLLLITMTEPSRHAVMLLGVLEFRARRHVLLAMTASCPALPPFVRWNQPDHASYLRSRSIPPPSLSSIKGPSFPSSLQIFSFLSFFPSLSRLLLFLHLLPLCTLPFLSLSVFTQTRMGLWSLICTQRCISQVPVSGWVVTAVLEVDSITAPDLTRPGSQELPIVGSTPAFEMSLRGCLRPPV